MKVTKILQCRRTFVSVFAIGCLTWLGLDKGIDVSLAIAGVVAAICGANSYESVGKAKVTGKVDDVG